MGCRENTKLVPLLYGCFYNLNLIYVRKMWKFSVNKIINKVGIIKIYVIGSQVHNKTNNDTLC